MFATAMKRGSRSLRVIALVAAAATALTLTACTSGGGGTGKKKLDTLTVALTAAPTSLDPTTAGNGLPLAWYMALAYEPLIERTPDGVAKPGLATSWSYSKDRLSFVLNLRKGVKFSDGSSVTAAAVVAWLKHYKAKGTFTSWLTNVSDITATGPLKVTLKLSTLDPLLPWGLGQAGNAGAVVSPTGLANASELGSKTFGAGPYELDTKATIANSSYVFVKNPHYFNPKVQYWKKIVLKVFTDQNSVLSAVRSGQVQVAQGSAANAAAASKAGLVVASGPSAMVGVYLGDIDGTLVPALKDVRVRQALNYAIDRQAITASIYGKYGTPTSQFAPKGAGGYVASLEKRYPYDPAKARKLLAQAGYPNGFSFTVLEQSGFDGSDLLPQAMVADWAKIGVQAQVKTFPSFADYVTALFSKKYPASTLNFNYSVQLVATTGLVTNPAVYNYMGYTDVKANKLATAQRAQDTDTPAGVKAAEASEKYMVDNAFLVPVTSIDAVMFSSKSVKDVDLGTFLPLPEYWKPAQ